MSAPTMSRSSYPIPVENLLPRARELAERLGAVPSQNRLKAELRIGTDKARAVRQHLASNPGPVPGAADAGVEPVDGNRSDVADSTAGASTTESSIVDAGGVLVLGSPVAGPVEPAEAAPAPVAPDATQVVAAPSQRVSVGPAAVPVMPVAVRGRTPQSWPVLLLALPAFVAIWSGWVGLGQLAGFGVVHPLPGIADRVSLNTAITLPIGVETYAAYALHVWLGAAVGGAARRFAKWSAIGSLLLGMAGQGAYHLMTAHGIAHAPWPVVTLVSCLPVAVLGMGAALAHLIRDTSGSPR